MARDVEMIRFGQDSAKIKTEFTARGRDFKGEMTIFRDKKRRVRINGIPVDKTSDLMGFLSVVMFCPDDLKLVKGSPQGRRRMLDLAMCQVSKKYFFALSQYIKTLEQRNKLLRDDPDSDSIWVWNEKLAKTGSDIIVMRNAFLERLGSSAAGVCKDISGETLTLKYVCGGEPVYEDFIKLIEKNAARERKMGISLVGPHRDDFDIFINDAPAKMYGSQGQQRTAAVALKLAEVAVIKDRTGEMPVLLLDDVMSELDTHRRKYIAGSIKDMQVIITCTSPEGVKGNNSVCVEDLYEQKV